MACNLYRYFVKNNFLTINSLESLFEMETFQNNTKTFDSIEFLIILFIIYQNKIITNFKK